MLKKKKKTKTKTKTPARAEFRFYLIAIGALALRFESEAGGSVSWVPTHQRRCGEIWVKAVNAPRISERCSPHRLCCCLEEGGRMAAVP